MIPIISAADRIEFLYVWSEARPEGKAIIIVLVVFSIFAWSVMAAKTMQIRRAKKLNRLFDVEFRQQKKAHGHLQTQHPCRWLPSLHDL